MTDHPTSLGDERIAEIRQRWEGFDWSCHGSALKGVQAVKDVHALLAALTTLQAEVEAREQAAIAEGRRQEREAISGASSEWFVCFHCWIAYHVPTTGYYGACQQCGHDTKRWPANPLETLRMMELNLSRKPSAQSEVER
jgi:hypothetical protein